MIDYRSDVSFLLVNPARVPPPVGRPRGQAIERDGRCTLCPSSAMSSGRLFLDQDGRHQSPSPLHRRPQHKIIAASNGTNYHRTVTSVLTGCLSRGDHPRLLFHNSIMEKLKLSHWIGSHDTLTSRLRAAKPETELISSVSRKAAYLYSRILLT
jgi:hypothetical protein